MSKQPHKHAELIKQWADGATIQYRKGGNPSPDYEWEDISAPLWSDSGEYRVKPEQPTIGQLFYVSVYPYPNSAEEYQRIAKEYNKKRWDESAKKFLALAKEHGYVA